MLILPFLFLFQSADAETYDALLRCAAFHTIEGERLARDEGAAAGDAQKAIATDFANAAHALLSADNEADAVKTDLDQRKTDYLARLAQGEVRETAAQWTALELACKELYPALSRLKAADTDPAEGR